MRISTKQHERHQINGFKTLNVFEHYFNQTLRYDITNWHKFVLTLFLKETADIFVNEISRNNYMLDLKRTVKNIHKYGKLKFNLYCSISLSCVRFIVCV